MTNSIKVSGSWKDISDIQISIGGAWKSATEGYVSIGGVWKQFWSTEAEAVSQYWTQRYEIITTSGTADYERLGDSCAISADGTILAVGVSGDNLTGNRQGSISVFDWNGSSWTERTINMTSSDIGDYDYFGRSCALSADGTILAVGASEWDGGAGSQQGAMYVFDWNGSSWTERTTALTASDADASDYFGRSCALSADGTVLAVGADGWTGDHSRQGCVYIFDWNGSSWVERAAVVVASDAGSSDYFGYSCALSSDGTVLAVGAVEWDGAAGEQGAVYVFDWNGSSWTERTTALTASDAGTGDYFGRSCALSADGTVLAVGATGWDGGITTSQGAVYIYDWNDSSWTERTTALVPFGISAFSSWFGSACALTGDGLILAVGFSGWFIYGESYSDQGAVYIFDNGGYAWPERTTALTASDAEFSDNFGRSCALSADGAILAVGAEDHGVVYGGQGAVYIYDWNGLSWDERGIVTASNAGSYDSFGSGAALSADGLVLAVGANDWDITTGGSHGAVYVFDWNGSSWDERTTAFTAPDAGIADYFGRSCALSADGTVLAVGATGWDGGGGADQGCVYIFDWNGSSWVQRGSVITNSDAGTGDYFGRSCALSADGTVLAVGATGWDGDAGSGQGAMYVFDWNGSSWTERTTALLAPDAGSADYFGYSCALSSDGTVLAVGAANWDIGIVSGAGGQYIFDWNGSSWELRGSVITPSDQDQAFYFGSSCALSADGNILAVGASDWNGSAPDQGAVYVFDSGV